jgi:signal transduction histidine kinase
MTLKEEAGEIRYLIEDNGPGINETVRKHMFDKFYQGDSSHREEGNGLGLALVKQILEVCGGTITAENCPSGGCRFLVTLKV